MGLHWAIHRSHTKNCVCVCRLVFSLVTYYAELLLGIFQPSRMAQLIHLSICKTTWQPSDKFMWDLMLKNFTKRKRKNRANSFQFSLKSHNLMNTSVEGLLSSVWVSQVKPSRYIQERNMSETSVVWKNSTHILCCIYFSIGVMIYLIIKQKYFYAYISKQACLTIMACLTK
jgi:hypothetical protein